MAHIPMDDIQELWKDSDHSWKGLQKTLEQHKNKSGGISNTLVMDMLHRIPQLESKPFPQSAQDLYNMLNQQVQHMQHS